MNDMSGSAILAKEIYLAAIRAVQPRSLLQNCFKADQNSIYINSDRYIINRNLYVVGFGKAVLGMAYQVVSLAREHIKKGILSVPINATQQLSSNELSLLNHCQVEILEGGKDNLPDEASLFAATKIYSLVNSCAMDDVILVLISGGGSALLPLPKSPVTLEEKCKIAESLFKCGANITDVNTVRKKLSAVKGGGLARAARPGQIVSLILSDIIGDKIDYIASGPTIDNQDDPLAALNIIQKYKISVSENVTKALSESTVEEVINPIPRNYIIGNNMIALNAAAEKAKEFKYYPIILTDRIEGDVNKLAVFYKTLMSAANKWIRFSSNTDTFYAEITKLASDLNIDLSILDIEYLKKYIPGGNICFIAGGEPTLKVHGNGKGGRSQHLALLMAKFIADNNMCFLSAGTDGIDGPTDAAGAIVTNQIESEAFSQKLNLYRYLDNCDSYNFFKALSRGENQIAIGATGTNVMDIHIILVKNTAGIANDAKLFLTCQHSG